MFMLKGVNYTKNRKGETMCYTGQCHYEGLNGECAPKESECPQFMPSPCKCGSELMQMQSDGKYHCMECNKIID